MKTLLRSYTASAVCLAAGIAVFSVLPSLIGEYQQTNMTLVGIYFIAILGLNIVTGYSGQISLGQGAFMGVGAYTTAYLVAQHGVGDWWTIPVAGVVAGVAGLLFGLPALRLHGPYLALGTFALAVAFVQLAQSDQFAEVTGGSGGVYFGVPGIPPYFEVWGTALGLLLFAWFILGGKFGRSLRAVRDAELAAISSGLNPAVFKTLAFGLGAAYAGVAGALLAVEKGSITALDFVPTLSITLLVGTALGGFGALSGALFGALFIVYAPLRAEDISHEAPSVMYGLFLLAVLFLMPGGAAQLVLRLRALLSRATKRVYGRPTEEEGLSTSTRSER